MHRDVDKIVLAANDNAAVKTAIVCPPCICGPGRGLVNTRSMQVYELAKFTLKNGFAPVIGKGLTEWDYIHVHDLADLIVSLVESAQDPKTLNDPEFFGAHGYYFCEAGPFKWGDVAKCESAIIPFKSDAISGVQWFGSIRAMGNACRIYSRND